jgi:hypothetical protein
MPWWVWVSFAPMGLGAWAPIIPGVELRRRWWIAWGALWSVIAIAGWVLTAPGTDDGTGGSLLLLGWVGAIVTTLIVRPAYVRDSGSSFAASREAAEQRLTERREALELAANRPDLALELGIGRPDLPGAQHAGLVDANHAPVSALIQLPGIDETVAQRIVELREELNGFASVTDLGTVLDLDGNAVERLRDRAVFLPR